MPRIDPASLLPSMEATLPAREVRLPTSPMVLNSASFLASDMAPLLATRLVSRAFRVISRFFCFALSSSCAPPPAFALEADVLRAWSIRLASGSFPDALNFSPFSRSEICRISRFFPVRLVDVGSVARSC